MQIILIIVGAIVGMWLGRASDQILGLGLGGGFGYLLGQIGSLKSQLHSKNGKQSHILKPNHVLQLAQQVGANHKLSFHPCAELTVNTIQLARSLKLEHRLRHSFSATSHLTMLKSLWPN